MGYGRFKQKNCSPCVYRPNCSFCRSSPCGFYLAIRKTVAQVSGVRNKMHQKFCRWRPVSAPGPDGSGTSPHVEGRILVERILLLYETLQTHNLLKPAR